MIKYSLEIKQPAQKELDAIDDALFTRLDRKIAALAGNPRPAGCKKLKGYKDQWRVLYIVVNAFAGERLMRLFSTHPSTEDRIARLAAWHP